MSRLYQIDDVIIFFQLILIIEKYSLLKNYKI